MTAPNTSTGKYNAYASFLNWLISAAPNTGTPAWSYSTMQQQASTGYPLVAITEYMAPTPGSEYTGMIIAPLSTYPSAAPASQGVRQQMGIKIEIQVDLGAGPGQLQVLYQIRDLIRRVLLNAGIADDATGTTSVPGIEILDYAENSGSPPDTGISGWIDADPGAILERYSAPTEALPNIHTLELMLRFGWFELN